MSTDTHTGDGGPATADGSPATGERSPATGADAVLTVARFEGRNRVRVTGVVAVVFALYGAMFLWLGPQFVAGDAITDLIEALPPLMRELLGFESLQSLEGLLASEYYTFGWIVGLGGYVAYSAAGTVAGDLRDDRMDTLLAAPVSRRSVLLGKYLALLVPIVALNVVVPVFLYVASVAIGDPLAAANLAAVHLLSVPYLLLWAAVGVLLGVVVRRGRAAGRVALGLVFFGWLFEAFVGTTDYAWVGRASPMRYFDPPAVLIHGTYDVEGAGILLAVAALALAAGLAWFDRGDL